MKKIFLALMAIAAIALTGCKPKSEEPEQRERRGLTAAPAGVEAVDLGLPSGTKWANMNVGATKPEECGGYFSWGETTTKTVYDWTTYKWCKGTYDDLTKYCTHRQFGREDGKTLLETADDAATANWGSNWRVPTQDEANELIDKCKMTYTTINDIKCAVMTGPNGNSICLPITGHYWGNSQLGSKGSNARYFTNKIAHDKNNDYAYYCIDFYPEFGTIHVWEYGDRQWGNPVRAVYNSK